MIRPPMLVLAFCAPMVLGSACRREQAPILRLHDTEGRQLLAKCTAQGCELRQQGGPEWPEPETELRLQPTGLLLAVCNAAAGAAEANDSRWCRALECEDDRQCPPELGAPTGHCISGLCVDPTGELGPDDAVVLCLAGTGVGTGSATQVEAHAMGLNCGTPCVVPKTCRQP